MATVRIRGTWQLSLSTRTIGKTISQRSAGTATLEIKTATRAKVAGQITMDGKSISVEGRVVPGSPAVLTLHEAGKGGRAVNDGLEAILYIPPWMPSVDYTYDFMTGTMSVGGGSAIGNAAMRAKLLEVSGVQPFK